MKRIITSIFLRLTVLIFLLIFVNIGFRIYAQEESQFVIIKGTINGDTKGYNKVYCYGDGIKEVLEQEIKNGSFEFKIQFERPFYPLFYTEYDVKINKGYQVFGVLIDRPGLVTITAYDISLGFKGSNAAGLESALLDQTFKEGKSKIFSQISDSIKKQHGKSWVPNGDPAAETINKSWDSLKRKMFNPYVLKFIEAHKDSYVGVFYLNEYKDALDLNETVKAYDEFSEELKTSFCGRTISDYMDRIRNPKLKWGN